LEQEERGRAGKRNDVLQERRGMRIEPREWEKENGMR